MPVSYEITPQVCLRSPLGESLNHAISASGNRSIATSRNGNMAVFDIDREKISLLKADEAGDIWGVALSTSGLAALTVAAPDPFDDPNPDHWFLGLWDLRMSDLVGKMEIAPGCYHFAASPNQQIAMGAHGGNISWWHPEEHTCLGSVANPHPKHLWRLAVSGDGCMGASTSPEEAFLWDIAAKKSLKKITLPKPKLFGKPEFIGSIRFGTDHLYLGSSDGKVWVADLTGSMLEKIIETGKKDWLQIFDIHEKANVAAILIPGGLLEVWDLFSGQLAGAVETGHDREVTDIRINPDASRVVTAGKDGTVRVWSLREK